MQQVDINEAFAHATDGLNGPTKMRDFIARICRLTGIDEARVDLMCSAYGVDPDAIIVRGDDWAPAKGVVTDA